MAANSLLKLKQQGGQLARRMNRKAFHSSCRNRTEPDHQSGALAGDIQRPPYTTSVSLDVDQRNSDGGVDAFK